MSIIVGRVRESIYGQAAHYQVDQQVYIPNNGDWSRRPVKAIKLDHVYVEGRWWHVDAVRRNAPASEDVS